MTTQTYTSQYASLYFDEDAQPFRALVENINEAFWFFNPDGTEIRYVSPAIERLWQRPRAELYRQPDLWLSDIHADDRPRVEQSLSAYFNDPAAEPFAEDFRIVGRRTGIISWMHQRIISVSARNGELLGHLVIAEDITALMHSTEILQQSNEQLEKLSRYHEAVHEAQRTRIARDIHDELGQTLTILNLDLHWLLKSIPTRHDIQIKIGEMQHLIECAAKTVQEITLRLRPALLGSYGLEEALDWYISRFQHKNEDLVCRHSIELGEHKVDHECAITMYRVLQETLTNVSRHARAKTVSIRVTHDGHFISLSIEDDGVGIAEGAIRRHDAWGLIGMRERVDALRGKLMISGIPGHGTTISVQLPVSAARSHEDVLVDTAN